MADDNRRHEIALRKVVYEIPGAESLPVKNDIVYASVGDKRLTMDLYFPRLDGRGDHPPAVVFVVGYRDSGVQKVVGCAAKDMASYVSCGSRLHQAWSASRIRMTIPPRRSRA